MKALILAAGRGSRLGSLTDSVPKCFVEVAGRRLIDWQIATLHASGICDITIVTGYRAELFELVDAKTIHNKRWHESNMVVSLLTAMEKIDESVIVCYSDLLFRPEHVAGLMESQGEIVLAYDTEWLQQWTSRFEDPLSDAETFRLDGEGYITEIGNRPDSVKEVQGQYMGLFKVSVNGAEDVRRYSTEHTIPVDKQDMTSLFSFMVQKGARIKGFSVNGGWCEIDQAEDLDFANELIETGVLEFPENIIEEGRT